MNQARPPHEERVNFGGPPSERNPRVLVYDRIDPSDTSLDWLESLAVDITRGQALWESVYRYNEDEIIAAAAKCDAVMGASGARFTRRVIEALPDLKFISKYGIGVETIDMGAAAERGILVSNTPDQFSIDAVAEHTIAFILGLEKNFLNWTPQYMQTGGWRPGYFSDVLLNKTLGLVGLGRIAREVVKRLAGWQVKICAYDPFVTSAPPEVTMVDLPTLLAQSDIISLHASPNSDNKRLINAKTLSQMKKNALLINVGRAWLVDSAALREAIIHGQIAGAAIDVFDLEPPDPDDPLLRCPNVMFSPHAASWSRTGLERIGWQGARNLWSMLQGEPTSFVLNADVVKSSIASRQRA